MTVTRLVSVFQRHGVSLVINQGSCGRPGSARPDATNFGPTALKRNPDIAREEGDVLCYLGGAGDPVAGNDVEREHFEGEEETTLYVLNVSCSIYPSDAASSERQITRVKQALQDLAPDS